MAALTEPKRLGTVQVIATTASSATSAAFGSQTYMIRVVGNTAFHYKVVDSSGAAATTDSYMPANWADEVRVNPGQKISTIRASTGGLVTATDGSVWVTELSA
jgi:hypothetical protein